ncbi:outer membrane channel protein TolC [Vibrio ruber]|uniref:Outer membrane protein TolC n=1 Tax=Vibrio ruber (strain DSM 16370 / JCM 11486 / BCRC 17186 / CECT 7878 / LMG 23124 / VR1) TaxID=1123498 RepID=A0A1R4L9A5_VIBR1|nr:outer membrane channel protein TolC [Vibrio ruber]WNJ96189.1 outer membrane channel protein TolC [Vibrio ruber]SJN53135.1 Outer membrane protein TolC precursor [Vibrio ruber DSM 16370]
MKKLLPLCVSITLGSLSPIVWADTLAEIYDQAKQNDPQLLSAAAQRDSAYEAIKSTRGELLPQINLSTGYNVISSNKDIADSKQWSAGVTLSQTLYDRNSWLNLGIAEKSARQVDSQYAQTQQNLILRVAQAYFEVLRAKDNLAFVRAEKNAVARQLEQTKQRFEVGLSAITDVHDAQAQYDSVLADEVLAENSLTNSYEAIREITGQEHDHLSPLDTNRFSASKMGSSMTELVNEAQKKNLSLLTARISQDIAREKIALASSGHLPNLSLDAGYSTKHEYEQSNANYNAFDPINNVSVGVNLSVPLYTGGKITAETKRAEYGLTQASQDLEASYRSVVKNVRAYNNNINASIEAIRAYQQAVVSAKSALQATEAGFDVGTRTIVDVLDSTRRLYDANRNLSDARYDYILNVLQLKQAVGTLNEQDILDINAGLK